MDELIDYLKTSWLETIGDDNVTFFDIIRFEQENNRKLKRTQGQKIDQSIFEEIDSNFFSTWYMGKVTQNEDTKKKQEKEDKRAN